MCSAPHAKTIRSAFQSKASTAAPSQCSPSILISHKKHKGLPTKGTQQHQLFLFEILCFLCLTLSCLSVSLSHKSTKVYPQRAHNNINYFFLRFCASLC